MSSQRWRWAMVLILVSPTADRLSSTRAMGAELCAKMSYVDQNQIDTRIRIRRVAGVALEQSGPVPGVCVGLFAEPDHELINAVATNDHGAFTFPKVPKGTYRIVATYDA